MNLMSLVRRSLRQHALSSIVTIISVGLAAGLTMSVFAINTQTYDAFTGGKVGFDAVLGARGSQLQLYFISKRRRAISRGRCMRKLPTTRA
jgi:putative ABC transport system permease protein